MSATSMRAVICRSMANDSQDHVAPKTAPNHEALRNAQ